MSDFDAGVRATIARHGPIRLDDYMRCSNAHYYAHADPLGADFATAPELTQVFGEVIGLWAADLWDRAGRPQDTALAELGPGRGALMADATRAAAKAGFDPPIHFVETSPALRVAQAARVRGATWHDAPCDLPADGPLVVIANEFLDALPVRQFAFTGRGWRERAVGDRPDGALDFVWLAPPLEAPPLQPPPAPEVGGVFEVRDDIERVILPILARLVARGGAALFIDYGHVGPATGETLQATRGGARVAPLAHPGAADLTAHVDFEPVIRLAALAGCAVYGPVPQGRFLTDLGLHQRTAALASANPAEAARLQAAALRLTRPQHMGALFKVLAIVAPDWPRPAAL